MNTLDDSSTNGVQCAQCCTVNSSVRRVVHVVGHIGLNVGDNVLVVVHNVP